MHGIAERAIRRFIAQQFRFARQLGFRQLVQN
jgi:hypothetical protein